MTTETLVKPATIQEQLLGKISEMRQKNLTAKQKEEIKNLEKTLMSCFKEFSWHYFGVSEDQIQELSDQEISALYLLVLERVRKTATYMRILCFSIPVIGWFGIYNESATIQFSNSGRKFKLMVGSDFNPAQTIRSRLNQ